MHTLTLENDIIPSQHPPTLLNLESYALAPIRELGLNLITPDHHLPPQQEILVSRCDLLMLRFRESLRRPLSFSKCVVVQRTKL